MRIARPLVALLLLSLAAVPSAAQGNRDAIARLEAARARTPENAAALRALGVAYYKAQRYADARPVLEQARRLAPKDGVSALYAGMAAEQTNDLTAARSAYENYLQVGSSRRTKTQIRSRLVALTRQEAIAAAKAAVANESRLSQTPGNPRTVAVPPLTFRGADSSLKPLERGLAELLITDLSRSSQLTVVERDRMQAIADEIRLSQSDRVDGATAVRAGKLIQAGTLVNGLIQQTGAASITIDASLVNVNSGAIGTPATVNNTLDQLFDAEKRLVMTLFERLNITLTPAEQRLVGQRPTSNLQAFLAYSRGLQAADDGRFEDAARFFETARSLDPGFGAAASRAAAVQAAVSGGPANTTTIEASVTGIESQVVQGAQAGNPAPVGGGLAETINRVTVEVNPPAITPVTTVTGVTSTVASQPQRDPSTSTTGTDQVSKTGQVVIVIRRP